MTKVKFILPADGRLLLHKAAELESIDRQKKAVFFFSNGRVITGNISDIALDSKGKIESFSIATPQVSLGVDAVPDNLVGWAYAGSRPAARQVVRAVTAAAFLTVAAPLWLPALLLGYLALPFVFVTERLVVPVKDWIFESV